MKMSWEWLFSKTKMNVTDSLNGKSRWINGSFVYFPWFLSELWSLNGPKKNKFLQFSADLSKKPKSVKVIYIYPSESSHYTLLENDVVYRSLSHSS